MARHDQSLGTGTRFSDGQTLWTLVGKDYDFNPRLVLNGDILNETWSDRRIRQSRDVSGVSLKKILVLCSMEIRKPSVHDTVHYIRDQSRIRNIIVFIL